MKIVTVSNEHILLEAEGQIEREAFEKWGSAVYGQIYVAGLGYNCDDRDGNARTIHIQFHSPMAPNSHSADGSPQSSKGE